MKFITTNNFNKPTENASKTILLPELQSICTSMFFCGICRRQCRCEFNTVFRKSCIIFCVKPKEADPIELISLKNEGFDSTQIYN